MICKHIFHKGNSLKVMNSLLDASIDMVFADPPYGIGGKAVLYDIERRNYHTVDEEWDKFGGTEFKNFNREWISEALRVLKPTGTIWVSGTMHNIYLVGYLLAEFGVKFLNHIVWYKRNSIPNITCRMFTHSTEEIIWACKGDTGWAFNYKDLKELNNGKQMRNLWDIPMTPEAEKWAGEHPTQKPEEVLGRIILASTNEGDLILDPFGGSGTTSVMAAKLNRSSIYIDLSSEYREIALRRVKAIVDQVTFNVEHKIEIAE